MMKYRYLILLVVLGLVGCQQGRQYFPKHMPEQTVKVVRFDLPFLQIDSGHARQQIEQLYADFPLFMPFYVEDVLGVYGNDSGALAYLSEAIPAFINDTIYGFKQTNQCVREQFNDFASIQKELDGAFTRLHYIDSSCHIPTIYTFVSGFNGSVFFVGDEMAVGLDMYLGSNYPYYNQVVYEYQKFTMRKECMSTDLVSAYLFRNYEYTSTQSRLLDQMIYRGKMIYLTSLLLPSVAESEVMGYTKEQWEWCTKNEAQVWRVLMDRKDLFKTESVVLSSYMNDGPFCSELSQDCPSRIGTWLGWHIVRSYMENNPTVSLMDMLLEGDAQKVLELSNYRP